MRNSEQPARIGATRPVRPGAKPHRGTSGGGDRRTETVELAGAEIGDVLSGRRLAIDELGAEIATRTARKLPRRQRDIWEEEGPYASGQRHEAERVTPLRGASSADVEFDTY